MVKDLSQDTVFLILNSSVIEVSYLSSASAARICIAFA